VCRLEDLIDKSPLVRINESIDREDQNELLCLLQKSVLPDITNDKFISFTAWNFDANDNIRAS
jgi:hypothetical protein